MSNNQYLLSKNKKVVNRYLTNLHLNQCSGGGCDGLGISYFYNFCYKNGTYKIKVTHNLKHVATFKFCQGRGTIQWGSDNFDKVVIGTAFVLINAISLEIDRVLQISNNE